MPSWPTIIELTHGPLENAGLEIRVRTPADGAVAGFAGVVRDRNQGRKIRYLEYEAYESLARGQMQQLAEECRRRWPAHGIGMLHRLGRVEIGEASVLIAVAAEHREPALQACGFLIDGLKREAAIWKKEFYEQGSSWLAN